MATLGSPGVSVSVIDESFYTPAAPSTTPMIFVATAQDKKNSSGTGTAQGTTAANAGKVWIITSQRDLTDTFGTPTFYTDVNGNPIHGGELNEYGLQAAYSLLGVSSRAYVARADIDLGALVPNTDIPKGSPTAGTYWLDTKSSLFGINEWNSSGRGSFVAKTPLIIDDSNKSTASQGGLPKDNFGKQGDYAVYVTSDNGVNYLNTLFYKSTATTNAWLPVTDNFEGGKSLAISPHTQIPAFTTSTANGSLWIKTTTPGLGANWSVKYYSGATQTWGTVNAPLYNSTRQAIEKLDLVGGGKNIPAGTVFVETDPTHGSSNALDRAEFRVWRRNATSPTNIVSAASTATQVANSTFVIRETLVNTSTWSSTATITVVGSSTATVGAQLVQAINVSSLVNVSASYNATTNKATITHALGGDIEFKDATNTPLAIAGFSAYNLSTKTGTANLYQAPADEPFDIGLIATNWKPLVYEATQTAPYTLPANGTIWYDARLSEADIMINDGTKWVGYKHYNSFLGGMSGGQNLTDVNGPLISATKPTTQSDGTTDLQDGDIWVSTANADRYGKDIYVWDGNALEWVLQDVTDQTSPNGWVFRDARWSDNGQDNMEYVTPISELLVSDYVDPDVVDPLLYPKGTRLWNLRRSGFNIKKYVVGHIDTMANNGQNTMYQNDDMSDYSADRWVTVSPNNEDGSGTFGRLAQRGYVVSKLKAMIDTNTDVRDTDTLVYNLIATPGYPEAIANMVSLNTDRGQTAFVVGDTPFRLEPNATTLNNWGSNKALAFDNSDAGAVTYDSYMAMFYPSGFTTDNTGKNIVVPPSHMMLRTIVNSDAKSYQWFAPAGTRRGGVDNATSVGYIESTTGEFKTVALYEGLRNTLHDVKVNPIATLPGVGIVNFGQYTRSNGASALDRINVARLVAYLRRQLAILAKPFLFEPNDAQTRREIKAATESLLIELVGQRALYDFIVVCDTSNNTPARIDRSELWLDVAIEPVKAVEFIYIPLRILNTGAIASGDLGAGFPGSN
jgi:hypothetical protein